MSHKLNNIQSAVDYWKERYEEERAIVDKIWAILGNPTYKELKGKSIYELIEDLKFQNDILKIRGRPSPTEEELEKIFADWKPEIKPASKEDCELLGIEWTKELEKAYNDYLNKEKK